MKKPAAPRKTKAEKDPAAKPAAAKKPRTRKKTPEPPLRVFIDFPQPAELVRPGAYTLRLGAVPAAAWVEVSIDGGPWTACREAAGYWWYDWTGFEPGTHAVEGRARGADGATAQSGERRFRVGVEAETEAGGAAPSAEAVAGNGHVAR